MKERKERNSNFELLRINSMFFIVFWHVIQHTNAFDNSAYTFNYIISFIFILLTVHVNSFVLVTGYYQYNKKVKYKKVLNLLLVVLFYNITYLLIDIFYLGNKATPLSILENTSILNLNNYWFINYYLILYLISPLLNKYIENSTQKEHRNLLIIMFICLDVIPYITAQRPFINNGLTLIGFIFLYLVGAYFAKYPLRESIVFKNFTRNKLRLLFLFGFIMMVIFNYINYHFGKSLITSTNPILLRIKDVITNQVTAYSNPILFLQTVFYFLYFGELSIKSKLINYISSLTFGVYLVHENRVVFCNLYDRVFSPITEYTTSGMVVKMFILALILFFVGSIIEMIRKIIAYKISKLRLIVKLKEKITKYAESFLI